MKKTNKQTGDNTKARIIKWLWIVAMAPFVILFAMLLLTALGAFGRMPSFEELENPKSNLATEIYSDDGKVLGSFFVQNRSYVQYADLFPQDSTQLLHISGREVPPIAAALIATEDARFYSHSGVDIPSLFRVGIKTIALQRHAQGGGSTVTQQLAKNLFPRNDMRNDGKIVRATKLVVAKLKEWITAIKLEYNYTKEEIVAMYLNTVEWLQRLRHQVGSNDLLRQIARRTQFAGGGNARWCGERSYPLLACAQPGQCPQTAQPRTQTHCRIGRNHLGAIRFDIRTAHHAQLPSRFAQQRSGNIFPRDVASGDECRTPQTPTVPHGVGLR